MVTEQPATAPQPEPVPPVLLRQVDVAELLGVSKPAVQIATRQGRLRPAAFLRYGRLGRTVPVYTSEEAARWLGRRLRRQVIEEAA